MELLFKQFSQFKARVNSQYHAKRNQKLEAIIKDHQHQSRVARISRPILPESHKSEDLEAWRVGQVLPSFLFERYFVQSPTASNC
jgi:hypothetical protein